MIQLPSQIVNAVIFKPNEKSLCLWRFSTLEGDKLKHGFLIATNYRLIFLEETGIFTKKYTLFDSIDYENIRGISITGWIFKSLQLDSMKYGEYHKSIIDLREVDKNTMKDIGKINVENVRILLNTLIQQRLELIEEMNKKSRIQYILDFSFLKAEMERGGITLTMIKCPSCGANIDLPKEGSSFECNYCKNIIHAHDVYQKMKGLIQNL